MKYALINSCKAEAVKGTKGFCPVCGSQVVAKCGEIKISHWSHKGNRNCDSWWENETDWHRSWKNSFPVDWQEIVHSAENGEKHIADIKTENGWVLEFQHSFLKSDERISRNTFYKKLVWIVDGNRRQTDKMQFNKMLKESSTVINKPMILQVHLPEECRLLKEWHDSNALVFFDFRETNEPNKFPLWFLFPMLTSSQAFLSPFSRQVFIEMHKENKFDEFVRNSIIPLHKQLTVGFQNKQRMVANVYPNRPHNFKLDLAAMRMKQRRFRF